MRLAALSIALVGCWRSPPPPVAPPPPAPTRPGQIEDLVVAGTEDPTSLVIADDYLYWINGGRQIWRAPHEVGATGSVFVETEHAQSLVLAGDRLAWHDEAYGMRTVPRTGGEPAPLAEIQNAVWSVAYAKNTLLVATYDPVDDAAAQVLAISSTGSVRTVASVGGKTPELVLAPDGEVLVSTTEDSDAETKKAGIWRLPPGKAVPVANMATYTLTADRDNVYFVGYHPNTNTVYRVPRGGGEPTEIATGKGSITAIAVDDRYVYWGDYTSEPDGALMRMPKTGGKPEKLAEIGEITTLAIVGPYLYWCDPRKDRIARIRR